MASRLKLRFPKRFRTAILVLAALLIAAAAWAKTGGDGRIPNESGLIELYVTGGVFMHPILLCSVLWLATVANIAPLLGFLGTVSGMIHAFEAIAAAEEVSAKLVATGIYEALITTAAGLIVAIPVQTAHNYFVSRIDKFVIDME